MNQESTPCGDLDENNDRPLGSAPTNCAGLALGIVTLVVLGLLIAKLREPSELADLGETTAKPQATSPPAPLPKPTGPTDEDPDQAEEVQTEYQAITDGTRTVGPEEMFAYNRLVSWVKNQSFARLWRGRRRIWRTPIYTTSPRNTAASWWPST